MHGEALSYRLKTTCKTQLTKIHIPVVMINANKHDCYFTITEDF